jgi:saccharopine dehydrogenase (NAD+, L-lysine-forming)
MGYSIVFTSVTLDYLLTAIGLQGIPTEENRPLQHQHMCFSYSYNQQAGWKELLTRFVEGSGSLLDIEYLVDQQGRRLTTFATIAGHIGMAIGILVWCHQTLDPQNTGTPTIKRRPSKELIQLATQIDPNVPLLEYIKSQLHKAIEVAGQPPTAVVLGAKGRVGSGAMYFAQKLGLQPAAWGRNETKVSKTIEIYLNF